FSVLNVERSLDSEQMHQISTFVSEMVLSTLLPEATLSVSSESMQFIDSSPTGTVEEPPTATAKLKSSDVTESTGGRSVLSPAASTSSITSSSMLTATITVESSSATETSTSSATESSKSRSPPSPKAQSASKSPVAATNVLSPPVAPT